MTGVAVPERAAPSARSRATSSRSRSRASSRCCSSRPIAPMFVAGRPSWWTVLLVTDRRLPHGRRRERGQHVPRPRHRRRHGAHAPAPDPERAHGAAGGARVRRAAGDRGDVDARALRQRAHGGARARGLLLLRLRLHALAQALHRRRTSSSAARRARSRRSSAGPRSRGASTSRRSTCSSSSSTGRRRTSGRSRCSSSTTTAAPASRWRRSSGASARRCDQMLWYTVVLLALTVLPVAFGAFGLLYLAIGARARRRCCCAACCRSAAARARRRRGPRPAWWTYKYSLLYLALLFVAMVVDRALA